ncbi:MAG TPA: tetratricopeptide repeat protein [Gallionella sp.]|nr:tetratricopeptide repeat protein [Gallionella sp.]
MDIKSKVGFLLVGVSLLAIGVHAETPSPEQLSTDSPEQVKLKNAASSDPGEMYQLATKYEDGNGMPRDMGKAIALYRQAAERGYVQAQTYLGVIYDKGRGVQQDDAEAIRWYRLAAEKDDPQSQFNLGVFLIKGRGTEKNEKEGWDLIRKAAGNGYKPASAALLRVPN